jgi:hypothetical protein
MKPLALYSALLSAGIVTALSAGNIIQQAESKLAVAAMPIVIKAADLALNKAPGQIISAVQAIKTSAALMQSLCNNAAEPIKEQVALVEQIRTDIQTFEGAVKTVLTTLKPAQIVTSFLSGAHVMNDVLDAQGTLLRDLGAMNVKPLLQLTQSLAASFANILGEIVVIRAAYAAINPPIVGSVLQGLGATYFPQSLVDVLNQLISQLNALHQSLQTISIGTFTPPERQALALVKVAVFSPQLIPALIAKAQEIEGVVAPAMNAITVNVQPTINSLNHLNDQLAALPNMLSQQALPIIGQQIAAEAGVIALSAPTLLIPIIGPAIAATTLLRNAGITVANVAITADRLLTQVITPQIQHVSVSVYQAVASAQKIVDPLINLVSTGASCLSWLSSTPKLTLADEATMRACSDLANSASSLQKSFASLVDQMQLITKS